MEKRKSPFEILSAVLLLHALHEPSIRIYMRKMGHLPTGMCLHVYREEF